MALYPPKTLQKIQKFYEFILVDPDSIAVKQYKDHNNDAIITHFTAQILQIIYPSAWRDNPNTFKKLSQKFNPQYYNYWDYQNTWYLAFLFQNIYQCHSWLFYFKTSTEFHFPFWFADQ